MEKETQFTGVWVPEKIIRDKRLLPQEKIVGAYVYSMCLTTEGCFASNAHLAKLFNTSQNWASQIVSKLTDLGYCYLANFNGKTRLLRTRLLLESTAAFDSSQTLPLTPVKLDNKDYNKVDNSLENNNNGVGKEAKICLDYFHDSYVNKLGEKPTIAGGAEIKLLKIILRNNDVSAVEEVMDAFFEWDRADYTLKQFYNRFDVVRLKLKEKAEGRR